MKNVRDGMVLKKNKNDTQNLLIFRIVHYIPLHGKQPITICFCLYILFRVFYFSYSCFSTKNQNRNVVRAVLVASEYLSLFGPTIKVKCRGLTGESLYLKEDHRLKSVYRKTSSKYFRGIKIKAVFSV